MLNKPEITEEDWAWATRIARSRARLMALGPQYELSDIEQEARIALFKAWQKWDPSINDSLQGYAITAVQMAVAAYVRTERGLAQPRARRAAKLGDLATVVQMPEEIQVRAPLRPRETEAEAAAKDAIQFIRDCATGVQKKPQQEAKVLLKRLGKYGGAKASAVDIAQRFLRRQLSMGPQKAAWLKKEGVKLDISTRSLDRAAVALKVEKEQKYGCWWWKL